MSNERPITFVDDFGGGEEFTPVAVVERVSIGDHGPASVAGFRDDEAREALEMGDE